MLNPTRLAVDGATVTALASSPWWLQAANDYGHLLLIALAVAIGVLRLSITWREWRRSRRWRIP